MAATIRVPVVPYPPSGPEAPQTPEPSRGGPRLPKIAVLAVALVVIVGVVVATFTLIRLPFARPSIPGPNGVHTTFVSAGPYCPSPGSAAAMWTFQLVNEGSANQSADVGFYLDGTLVGDRVFYAPLGTSPVYSEGIPLASCPGPSSTYDAEVLSASPA